MCCQFDVRRYRISCSPIQDPAMVDRNSIGQIGTLELKATSKDVFGMPQETAESSRSCWKVLKTVKSQVSPGKVSNNMGRSSN